MVVFCGEDSGEIRTHKLFLAALSPYLSQVLSAQDSDQDDLALVLPDVSSGWNLFRFLGKFTGKFITTNLVSYCKFQTLEIFYKC